MDAVITRLVENLPSAVAIIIVVVLFIRYIEKRDARESEKAEQENARAALLIESLNKLKNEFDTHHAMTMDAIDEMRKNTRARKRVEAS